eukprot:TRINITY_DN23584_c0_g1_i1.p1 TRINITY_DN23584_c0_g1~~TRINITY_DN23584_c0_g1_i1.p1  ORF type:complete len:108 (+),score=20.70 TRINITY_DN23584_c0_g1_i1:175-498(+)
MSIASSFQVGPLFSNKSVVLMLLFWFFNLIGSVGFYLFFQALANFSLKKAEEKEGISQMLISKLSKEEKKESEKSPQVQSRKMRQSSLCFAPEFDGLHSFETIVSHS